ncbi:MAG: Rrf2 family transcriptional regulator [Candidatus Omnitrophota bacterium]|nr:Rrf2 family transcriptional regulator [Candidatus Omnitrophota bacterium]
MMKITYKGDYSLKIVLDLALHYNQGLVTIHELAKRADIPIKFLEQVLLELKQGGFVDSKRGINGGYFLAKPPKEIKLGDVVRFIEGPIEPLPCANPEVIYKGCADIYKCVFKDIWRRVTHSISEIIDDVTFEDLCEKVTEQKKAMVYQI